MGALILHHISNPAYQNRKIHFYASSGGNAGLAAVCAARSLSYPCTVVLPISTSPLMVQKLRAAGATEVIQYGETIAAAGEYMRDVVMKEKTQEGDDEVVKIALHPFDHEAIWEGNSTIVDELVEQLPEEDDDARPLPVDALICSVGGGGLMNGLVRGIERQRQRKLRLRRDPTLISSQKDPKNIHILAAETEGTASLALAMSHRSLVSLPKITSQATSLGCVRVSAQTLEYSLSPPPGIVIHSVVLSDADAAKGVLRLVDDERLLVELACGVCVETAVGEIAAKDLQRWTKRRKRLSSGDEGYGDDRDGDDAGGSRNSSSSTNDGSSSSTASFADSAVASDEEIETMISPRQLTRLKQLVPDLTPESKVVIIVCGGSNVTIYMAWEWRKKLECGWT
jgi:L-serine/L-threonine ammonia-lyase